MDQVPCSFQADVDFVDVDSVNKSVRTEAFSKVCSILFRYDLQSMPLLSALVSW